MGESILKASWWKKIAVVKAMQFEKEHAKW